MDASAPLPPETAVNVNEYGLLDGNDTALFVINTVFLILAIVSVAGRFWAQRSRGPWYFPEDALCLGSLLAFIAQCGITYVLVLRNHATDLYMASRDSISYSRMLFAAQLTYGVEMGLVRASVILFELRLFGVKRWFKQSCYVMLILTILWMVVAIVVTLTFCHSIQKGWDLFMIDYCGNFAASYGGIAGAGMALDLMIFILPMPIIWKLHGSSSRKILPILLFAIGLFDIICGGMRLVSFIEGTNFNPVVIFTWAILEPSIAILVACAPHYGGLYDAIAREMSSANAQIRSILGWIHRRRTSGRSQSKEGAGSLDDVSERTLVGGKSNSTESLASSVMNVSR